MKEVPTSALILGLAGLIPFLWGAGTVVFPGLSEFGAANLGPRFIGIYVLNFYGTIILAFMSGVLWGFATKAEGARAGIGYALSVIPALWAFFMVGGGAESSVIALIAGYAGLLLLDAFYWQVNLAPRWWMRLRIPLTAVVVACLAVSLP
ncbi:DUF3429 domain-containing protein [Rhodovulum euryhalinum]|uniref:Uncharacterized protein DUF3429 n=1 Tax=Rhodovulum euryhalinum TaxID=35805 RepID=A0A4R2K9A0_9RHOB|nr:DUF3429 domain-containing protein [Rhodovulum euryhalinum]TCO69971.1 uncharacterized protein DUF3429 [Rhodovulum euryhalinum]